ncbi:MULTISPECIES: hypothetical protein [unclassified Oceanispirochaeta]|jgi:hypothetical protein|uniref:hypothetical protein n=1 Tax=unclassified Oceanispirochaeta TaxID=2635722 RepID=UPI000E095B9B|nr:MULTISPECIES: hypothetical protein [unclassified Oceanispirochaeta]MBF9016688.1 hypothetical protein [Oceanispirochaeta sp. M2]NPD73107.1 hypothetical protein [Oceanispirochaeta sp. M1]RDG31208.1 hypothetical protein DV872_13465 [Oceanispirochaeta sp. M1]
MAEEKSFNKKVAEVISTFDFMRVKQVMDYLNWNWAGFDGTPDEEALIKKATDLLEQVGNNPGEVCGSGGFRASCKQNGTLSLKFILTESWSDPPDETII